MTTSKTDALAQFQPAIVNKLRVVVQDAQAKGKATTAVLVGSKEQTKVAANALAQSLGRSLIPVSSPSSIESVMKTSDPGKSILFFDEGDALFGKRTDVKDSHDKYANLEISAALDHMKSYAGLSLVGVSSDPDATALKGVQHVVQVASK